MLRCVLDTVKNDVRSVTGKNLRYMKMRTKNFNEKELDDVYDEPYKLIPNEEIWRVAMAKEIIGARCGDISIDISKEELDDIADFVCGS